jgi:hypothetical protein
MCEHHDPVHHRCSKCYALEFLDDITFTGCGPGQGNGGI